MKSRISEGIGNLFFTKGGRVKKNCSPVLFLVLNQIQILKQVQDKCQKRINLPAGRQEEARTEKELISLTFL